jgi:hypothetical protein
MRLLKIIIVLMVGFGAGWISAQDQQDPNNSSTEATANTPSTSPDSIYTDLPLDATEGRTLPPQPNSNCSGCNAIEGSNTAMPRTDKQADISKAAGTLGGSSSNPNTNTTPANTTGE